MSVITGQGVTAYPLPDEELSPTSKNAVSNEAVCEGLNEIKNTLSHKADVIYDTASGDIASFPDGADGLPVKDLTVGIEPVQDLHGYDHPWPAGGGKNKLNLSLSSMKSRNSSWSWNENVATNSGITITVYTEGSDNVTGIKADGQNNSGTYLRFTVDVPTLTKDVTYTLSGAPSGYSGVRATIYLGSSPSTIGIQNPAISDGVPVTFTPTQTGSPTANINFDDNVSVSNAMFYPMIEVGSSATSFEPTSNICPISGWPGANVSRTGKNLLPMTVDGIKAANNGTWSGNSYTQHGVTFTIQTDSDGNVTGIMINGTNSSNSNAELNLYANNSFYLPNGDYVLNGAYSDSCRIFFYTGIRYYDSKPNPVSFTIDGTETASRCTVAVTKNTTVNNAVVYPMIRFASDADPTYEPSQSKDISITFPSSAGTVYGGTLDVTSGVLTVTHAVINLGDKTWTQNSGKPVIYQASFTDFKQNTDSLWCEIFKPISVMSINALADDSSYDNVICCRNGRNEIIVKDTSVADAAELTALIAGKKLVYEIANPQTYQLTPTEVITTLLGQNNVWADCGPVSVEYPADTKLYIQKINTPTDDDMIADANIASGQYFIVNNNLYISTAAILAGDPIKPGTNCTKTDLAAALNALNS